MSNEILPGVYSRIGTEQNPGSFRTGGGGVSSKPPVPVLKPWVLLSGKWNGRNYWLSGGIFSIPKVWLLEEGVWNRFGNWLFDGIWRMNRTLFSTNDIWISEFIWTKNLIWKV